MSNNYPPNPYNHPDYSENNSNNDKMVKIALLIFIFCFFSPVITFLLKTLFMFSIVLLIIVFVIIVSVIANKVINSNTNTTNPNNTQSYEDKQSTNILELEQRKNIILEEYDTTIHSINSLINSPAIFDKKHREYQRFNNAIKNVSYHSPDPQDVRELEHSWRDLVTKTRINGLKGLTQSQQDIAYQLYDELIELENDPVLYNHKLLELVNIITMVNYDGEMINIDPYDLLKNVDNS